jgi:hypothetical protein
MSSCTCGVAAMHPGLAGDIVWSVGLPDEELEVLEPSSLKLIRAIERRVPETGVNVMLS